MLTVGVSTYLLALLEVYLVVPVAHLSYGILVLVKPFHPEVVVGTLQATDDA